MELVHYSADPLVTVASIPRERQGVSAKPEGLWVSVDANGDGWRDWCRAEDIYQESFKHATRVVLSDAARVLRITTVDEIDAFHDEFKTDAYDGSHPGFECWFIDWRRVVDSYDAVVIAPYRHERRMELPWYYGWDVASGVLWNSNAISRLEPRSVL